MKLYLVCDNPLVIADIAIHNGRTIRIRGRGKTRLPDCSSVEFAKNFYKKLSRYPDIRLQIDMEGDTPATAVLSAPEKTGVPPPEAPAEEKKDEVPPEAPSAGEIQEQPQELAQAEAPTSEQPADGQELLMRLGDLMSKTKPDLIEMAKQKGIEEDLSALSKKQIAQKILGE